MNAGIRLLYYMFLNKGKIPSWDKLAVHRIIYPVVLTITARTANKSIEAILRSVAEDEEPDYDPTGKVSVTNFSFCHFVRRETGIKKVVPEIRKKIKTVFGSSFWRI